VILVVIGLVKVLEYFRSQAGKEEK